MNVIAPVVGTNNIRYADFVRITTATDVYRFSTSPTALTIPAVDDLPFSGLGQLVSVGTATRDIKSTANETTVTLVGIDTSMLSLVLNAGIKGSKIEMWHGFFDANNQLLNNQNLYSEEFNQTNWLKARSSITANITTAPDGTLTADKLIEDTSVTLSHYVYEQNQSFVAGETYTWSVYAKADTRTSIGLQLPTSAFTASVTAYFNLLTGVVTQINGVGTADIENVGDGWYRCSVTKTATVTTTGNPIYFLAVGTSTAYTGDGISGLFIWGGQLAIGSPVYTKTTVSALSGLYQFFNGNINSFSISEQWMEDVRSYIGTVSISASSIQLILQNRVSGRYTNDNSWKFYAPTDTSMNRVNYISTINYYFGKDAPMNT